MLFIDGLGKENQTNIDYFILNSKNKDIDDQHRELITQFCNNHYKNGQRITKKIEYIEPEQVPGSEKGIYLVHIYINRFKIDFFKIDESVGCDWSPTEIKKIKNKKSTEDREEANYSEIIVQSDLDDLRCYSEKLVGKTKSDNKYLLIVKSDIEKIKVSKRGFKSRVYKLPYNLKHGRVYRMEIGGKYEDNSDIFFGDIKPRFVQIVDNNNDEKTIRWADDIFPIFWNKSQLDKVDWNDESKVKKVKNEYRKYIEYIKDKIPFYDEPDKFSELYIYLRLKVMLDYYLIKNHYIEYFKTIEGKASNQQKKTKKNGDELRSDINIVYSNAKKYFADYKEYVELIQQLFLDQIRQERGSDKIIDEIKDSKDKEEVKNILDNLSRHYFAIYDVYFPGHNDGFGKVIRKYNSEYLNNSNKKEIENIMNSIYKKYSSGETGEYGIDVLREIFENIKEFHKDKEFSKFFINNIRNNFNTNTIRRFITQKCDLGFVFSAGNPEVKNSNIYKKMIDKYPILAYWKKDEYGSLYYESISDE